MNIRAKLAVASDEVWRGKVKRDLPRVGPEEQSSVMRLIWEAYRIGRRDQYFAMKGKK